MLSERATPKSLADRGFALLDRLSEKADDFSDGVGSMTGTIRGMYGPGPSGYPPTGHQTHSVHDVERTSATQAASAAHATASAVDMATNLGVTGIVLLEAVKMGVTRYREFRRKKKEAAGDDHTDS